MLKPRHLSLGLAPVVGRLARGYARTLNVHSRPSQPTSQGPTPTLIAGVQASESIHIGNYLGCIQPFLEAQQQSQEAGVRSFFVVADQHALHEVLLPKPFSQIDPQIGLHTRSALALLIACGIDPKKTTLFLQSHVPMVYELMWNLTCVSSLHSMKSDPIFKGASKAWALAGQTLYPVLMAADIILFKSTHVAIGPDMNSHLDFAIESAKRMNRVCGKEIFPECQSTEKKPWLIRNLRNSDFKMSKSDPVEKNKVGLLDSPDAARQKLLRAKTDSEGAFSADPSRIELLNLVHIYAGFRKVSAQTIQKQYEGVSLPTFKREMSDFVAQEIAKIQENYYVLLEDEAFLEEVIELGRLRALEAAAPTLDEVKHSFGYLNIH